MWIGVLARAVRDAQGNCLKHECAEARMWMMIPTNRNRRLACDMADLDERTLVRWAMRELVPLEDLFPKKEE